MRLPRPTVAAALLALLLSTACTGEADPAPEPEPEEVGTPLAAYDVGAAVVERGPYSDRIAATGVVAALDGTAADAEAWENGEQLDVGAASDVAHEYGCRYVRDDAQAATWLFAPPVAPGRAAALAREARREKGCREAPGAAPLGKPSVALVCDEGTRAAYRGLLGDAWVACEVTRDEAPEDLVDVAGRWCVEVVEAARAR